MANPISGLQSVVSQLRKERTNLVNQLRHVDAALSVLGKLNGGRLYTQPRHRKLSAAQASLGGAMVACPSFRPLQFLERRVDVFGRLYSVAAPLRSGALKLVFRGL